jgi:hypothetical protein
MNDLINALQIFSKYGNPIRPTHCEHDALMISPEINPENVSGEDKETLQSLGFFEHGDMFMSYKFGSC